MAPLVLAWSLAALLSSGVSSPETALGTGISREDVQKAVASYSGPIQDCYEAGLEKNPKLRGRVAVSFEVDERGRVTRASSAASTTLDDKEAVACIVEVFGKLDFEEQPNPVALNYSLLLEPPKDEPPPKK